MSKVWMTKEEADLMRDWDNRFWNGVLFGTLPKREPQPDDNVKLAYVMIDGQRTMIGVDNKTMQGYALRDDVPVWKMPLEPISYDSFERWCRGMDL